MTGQRSRDSIAIIGFGHVGATSAYTLMLRGVADELVLLDINGDAAEPWTCSTPSP